MEDQGREDDLPREAGPIKGAAGQFQPVPVVIRTQKPTPTPVPDWVSRVSQTAPGGPPNSPTDMPSAVNPQGVPALSIRTPRTPVLRTPVLRSPVLQSPVLQSPVLQSPVPLSPAPAAVAPPPIAGTVVPQAPDPRGSIEIKIAVFTLPAPPPAATAAPWPGARKAASPPTNAASVLLVAPVSAVASGANASLPNAPSFSVAAAPAEAPVAPLVERILGNLAAAATSPGEMVQPGEDPGSPETRNPTSRPRRAEVRLAVPLPSVVLEPSRAVSAVPAPNLEPEPSEPIPAVRPATASSPRAEPPMLAFAARLTPVASLPLAFVRPALPVAALSSAAAPQPPEAGPIAPLEKAVDKTGPQGQARSAPVNQFAETENHTVPKSAAPERAQPAAQDAVPASASFHSALPASPHTDTPAISSWTAPPDQPQPQRMTTKEAAPPAVRTEIESPPEAKPAAPAREIQIQVNRGEQRVDLRLTERGGEVLVAVRTPDPQLAGTLREDLPQLSSRLEQAGFRAETWHPAASTAESNLRTAEPHSAHTSSEDQNPSRQGGQEQEQQQSPHRQPKPPAPKAATNSPRKEFEWLMSQLH